MEPEGSLPHSQVPPTVSILSQLNPVHAPHPTYWRSNIIFPSVPGSPPLDKWRGAGGNRLVLFLAFHLFGSRVLGVHSALPFVTVISAPLFISSLTLHFVWLKQKTNWSLMLQRCKFATNWNKTGNVRINHCCKGKVVSITISECAFVVLFI
jgi:hypothetical protein